MKTGSAKVRSLTQAKPPIQMLLIHFPLCLWDEVIELNVI